MGVKMTNPDNPIPRTENETCQHSDKAQKPELSAVPTASAQPEEVTKTNPKDKASVYSFGSKVNIPKDRSADGLVLTLDEFRFAKNRIKSISCKSNDFKNWSFAAFGVAGSALITLISFCDKSKTLEFCLTLSVMVIGLIAALILKKIAEIVEKKDESTKTDVNAFLNLLERKFYDVDLEDKDSVKQEH